MEATGSEDNEPTFQSPSFRGLYKINHQSDMGLDDDGVKTVESI
jgi:hypothetical protein